MNQTFTTPNETVLPLLMIPKRVKNPDGSSFVQLNPYLQVQHRLVWFREVHPDWTIRTEVRDLTADSAIIQAFIETPGNFNDPGRVISTGMKRETAQGWEDFLEKAETGAIGRALAAAGFGTQFAVEMEDGASGGSPVDAPSPTSAPPPWSPPDNLPPPPVQTYPVAPPLPQGAQSPPQVAPRPPGGMTPPQEAFLCDLIRKKLEPGATTNAALVAALNAWAGTQHSNLAAIRFEQARAYIDALKAHGSTPPF